MIPSIDAKARETFTVISVGYIFFTCPQRALYCLLWSWFVGLSDCWGWFVESVLNKINNGGLITMDKNTPISHEIELNRCKHAFGMFF